MNKHFYLFIWFLVLVVYSSNAQTTICGVVTDIETKQALKGTNIWIENTVIGTTSDMNGNFCINLDKIEKDSIILVFSQLSYKPKRLQIYASKNKKIEVSLTPSYTTLDVVEIANTTKNEMLSFHQTTSISALKGSKVIENSALNIADIISQEASVSLVGQSYHKSPSIRGLARKRVVVMVDGSRISSERNVGPPGTFVNPLNVKSIEILRGPYSTLYGSDAVGGVINIITKDFKQALSNDFVGGVFASSYQSISKGYNVNLLLNTKIADKLFFHVTAGKRNANSYKNAKGEEVKGTNFSEKSISTKITWKINSKHKLKLSGLVSKADSIGKSAFSDSVNALHPKDIHRRVAIDYEWKNISSLLTKMNIKASAHNHQITARVYNYRTTVYGRVMNKEKNLYNDDFVYQHDFTFTPNANTKLLVGYDFYQRDNIHVDQIKRAFVHEPGTPPFDLGDMVYESPLDTIINNSYQRSMGVFIQSNYKASKKLLLNGGIRWNMFKTKALLVTENTYPPPPYDYSLNTYSEHTHSDKAFSGSFGVSYTPVENISLTGNIGQAFRTPSTRELYVSTMTPNGMTYADSTLVPEKSLNIDVGFRLKGKQKKQNMLSLFFYRNYIKEMITIKWNPSHTTGVLSNRDAILYGAEFSFKYKPIEKLAINANLSYGKGYEIENKVPLKDILPFNFFTNINYSIIPKKVWVGINAKFSSKNDHVPVGYFTSDSFQVYDLLTGWNINKYATLNLSVSNLFNNDYREHYQFEWIRKPGRSFNTSLKIKF